MKKAGLRAVSVFVAAVMTFSLFATCVFGEDVVSGQCGDNAYWELDLDTDTLTISGMGDMWDYR